MALARVVRELLGDRATEENVRLCLMSIGPNVSVHSSVNDAAKWLRDPCSRQVPNPYRRTWRSWRIM